MRTAIAIALGILAGAILAGDCKAGDAWKRHWGLRDDASDTIEHRPRHHQGTTSYHVWDQDEGFRWGWIDRSGNDTTQWDSRYGWTQYYFERNDR